MPTASLYLYVIAALLAAVALGLWYKRGQSVKSLLFTVAIAVIVAVGLVFSFLFFIVLPIATTLGAD